jgi:hypothetical protein
VKRSLGISLLITAMIAVSILMLLQVARVRGIPAAVIVGLKTPAGPYANPAASTLAPRGDTVAGMFTRQPIGATGVRTPFIAYVEMADVDQDGLMDVVVCDGLANEITWIRQESAGVFVERLIAADIIAPAHTQTLDFDGDGDNDILVASLGRLFPSNERIGAVIVLENTGTGDNTFTPRIVNAGVARVADVRAGDLDGDGDLDLVAAQFGADDGETVWYEQTAPWTFQLHILQRLNGTINTEVVDLEGDGDLDIVTIVSQEWEEVFAHVNDGSGTFESVLLYGAANDDFGSSGISVADLDGDGDLDVLYSNGDAFDYTPPRPRAWHGVQWLEQTSPLRFTCRRLDDFPGAYSPRAADFDLDGDLDIVASSGFNRWEQPSAQSLVWFEQVSIGSFLRHGIANDPTHQIVVETGDIDGDGDTDLVSGGMHFYGPYDRLGRVTIWLNNAGTRVRDPDGGRR